MSEREMNSKAWFIVFSLTMLLIAAFTLRLNGISAAAAHSSLIALYALIVVSGSLLRYSQRRMIFIGGIFSLTISVIALALQISALR
jgi:cytochrome b561